MRIFLTEFWDGKTWRDGGNIQARDFDEAERMAAGVIIVGELVEEIPASENVVRFYRELRGD